MAKFKAGDVVQLKSGGPDMTVTRVREDDGAEVSCEWFHEKHATGTCSASFLPSILQKVNRNKPAANS